MTKQPVPPVKSNYYKNLSPNSQEIPFGKSPIKKGFDVYSYNMAKPVPKTFNLFKITRQYHIPIDSSIGIWASNPDYEQLNPEDDYDTIINSIKNAEKFERLHEDPPAIIAVSAKKSMDMYGIPQWYYVKKDLLYVIVPDEKTTWRKKKTSKSKQKRKVCRCK